MNFFCKSLALALLVSLHSSAHAAAERRLQIGFATISPVIAPLWVAADRGFFAQEGLEPELVFIGSAPTLVASLIARGSPLRRRPARPLCRRSRVERRLRFSRLSTTARRMI